MNSSTHPQTTRTHLRGFGILLCAAMLSFMSCSSFKSKTQIIRAPGVQTGMDGVWEGVMLRNAKTFYLRLELESTVESAPASGIEALQGRLLYQEFKGFLDGQDIDAYGNEAPAQASYNHSTDTFGISIGQPRDQDRSGITQALNRAAGVHDQFRDRLAGQGPGQPGDLSRYFVLTRPVGFRWMVEPIEKFQGSGGVANIFKGFPTSVPSAEDLKDWYAPVMETRGTASRGAGSTQLQNIAIFEDEHFQRFFDGRTFDDLSLRKLDAMYKAWRQMPLSKNRYERELGEYARMFAPQLLSGGAASTTQAVIALRSIHSWRAATLAKLESTTEGVVEAKLAESCRRAIRTHCAGILLPGA